VLKYIFYVFAVLIAYVFGMTSPLETKRHIDVTKPTINFAIADKSRSSSYNRPFDQLRQ